MVDAKDVNKAGDQTQASNAGASNAGATGGQNQSQQPQAQQQPTSQPQVGQSQDLQLGAIIEEMRTYLQKTVDALNAVSSGMQSAQEVNRGLNETMSKIASELKEVRKEIGDIIAENKEQDTHRTKPPRDAAIDPKAGETAEHKEVMPTDEELKNKVTGKQTLGLVPPVTGAGADKAVAKTGGTTPAPSSSTKPEDIDISKSMVADILSGKLKGAGNVIARATGGKQ